MKFFVLATCLLAAVSNANSEAETDEATTEEDNFCPDGIIHPIAKFAPTAVIKTCG